MSDSNRNQIESAIEAGEEAVSANDRWATLGDQNIPVAFLRQDGGGMKAVVLTEVLALDDQRAEAPRRLNGTAILTEMESFVFHVNRFRDAQSVIFADVEKVRLTAVLNYHMGQIAPMVDPSGAVPPPQTTTPSPRWADHRSVYVCPHSRQWKTWITSNEKWMTQEVFGEFIEANLKDLANPTEEQKAAGMPAPATLLQVARNLRVYARHEFERTVNPSTGEGVFVHKKANDVQGSTTVPPGFLLGVQVFESGEFYMVEARLRFSVETPEGGKAQAKFRYELVTPHLTVQDAFAQVRAKAAAGTGLLVLAGSPEG